MHLYRTPLKKTLFVLIVGLVLLWAGACDGPFLAQNKAGVPDDHTVNRGGALHKSGLSRPFRESSGCSQADCHQSDLQGGPARVDGRATVAPSCYQCHGKRWSNNDVIAPMSAHDTTP